MKRLGLILLGLGVGVMVGAGIRYPATYQRGYRVGFSDGLNECHREAVLSGHGRWVTPGSLNGPVSFAWLPALEDYKPDTRIKAPGFLD